MTTVGMSLSLPITSFMFEALVISQCMPLLMVWTNIFNWKKVLYVPNLWRILIPISCLTEKHVRDECKMINHDGIGRILMIDSKSDGFLQLYITSITPSNTTNFVCMDDSSLRHPSRSIVNLHWWHTKLGHASLRTICDITWVAQKLFMAFPLLVRPFLLFALDVFMARSTAAIFLST